MNKSIKNIFVVSNSEIYLLNKIAEFSELLNFTFISSTKYFKSEFLFSEFIIFMFANADIDIENYTINVNSYPNSYSNIEFFTFTINRYAN
jgi:hypothetical protein